MAKACKATCIVFHVVKVFQIKSLTQAPPLHRPLHSEVIVPFICSMELHQYLFQTNFILLFFTVIAPPNPSSNYHDVFLKLSFVSVSLSASMLCLAGCTVGKMNRHTHSTSASLLVHCPRWQCWAPSLVWFPLQSQSALARPYS